MQNKDHVRLSTILRDQSTGRNAGAGGLGGYSLGGWALSEFRRKRNDPRLPGGIPPSQRPASRRDPYKEMGRAFAVMDGGRWRQERQPQKSQKRTPSHSAIGAQQWSTERGQREATGQGFSWKQRRSGPWLEQGHPCEPWGLPSFPLP